ncbi:hypothetical protein BVC80_1765g21 [Macleaya cordata]|uniref:SNRNP25 ubiquitin-like domain-containing protein n=1 Tax=Macleaya cordata TaxID=56857 RepID=A0A200QTD8_MACCD|nr:hypothetical protein BVC80_1765g21 [Macleaya cordata]
MPSIVDSPRLALLERRRSVSLPFSRINNGFVHLTSPYKKLPTQILIKLSVLKLDGSSFDVQIKRNATVAELKQAVEDVFTLSSKEGHGLISWSHVWGHFCLSYEGQKLINNKDYIQSFRIRDGDQLHFIRHLSVNHNRIKRRSKKQSAACQKNIKGSDVHEEKEETGWVDVNGDIAEVNDGHYYCEDNGNWDLVRHHKFKLTHFLKGWLSHSRLCFADISRSHSQVCPSRFSGKFIRMRSKFTLRRHYRPVGY